jgi:hypothetical protein
MTYRVASDIAGTILAMRRKVFHPHLVCRWTLDPASHRLSCAWAAPADGLDVARTVSKLPIARRGTATGAARSASL